MPLDAHGLDHRVTEPDPERRPADFAAITERLIDRRSFLSGSVGLGLGAFAAATSRVGLAESARASLTQEPTFEPVSASRADTVTVPPGYNWQVVASWGDPLWSKGRPFDPETRGSAASQALALGDNNDGMALFTLRGRSLLAVNHEYVNRSIFYGNRPSRRPQSADDVAKAKAAHGVSVFEIANSGGRWQVVVDSPYNRRITADSAMQLTGPAAGHEWLKTAADPRGTRSLGTWNNCGCGRTPWNTYLTCEENFNVYFSSSDPSYVRPDHLRRYGVGVRDQGYGWARYDERFDIARHPNEPNRAGYVVEIDPLDPGAVPKKRTALGRFKHENAEVVVADDGSVVVYLGDDEYGEFLYRFVSTGTYRNGGDNTELLADGELYAARFHDDGTGRWLHLSPQATGMASKAEVCIHTRLAASAVGATTMDRPEWVSAHPHKAELYCALTNNKFRGKRANRGGDRTPVGGPNPRRGNRYGQIVRWRPAGGDHTASEFEWDLYVLAGNPAVHRDERAGSPNISPENMFNSPDGLAFDSRGGLWIQTDGNVSNRGDFAGHGNNQMLLGDADTGEIRRFLVGPRQCEITGLTWSADRRTMFVGIQHPGEHFPGGGTSLARSSIIAIARDDGGVLG